MGIILSHWVNILNLGDELAIGLGTSLTRSRRLIGGVATLLTAGAVSIGGLIGFVGLVVPHGIRLLVDTDYRWVVPLSALGGALVLTLADLQRLSIPTLSIQVGSWQGLQDLTRTLAKAVGDDPTL